MKSEFEKLGYKIYGISQDSIKAQQRFIKKYNINFELLSDLSKELSKQLKVNQLLGVERTTFLFDENLVQIKEWRKVKVDSHIFDVYDYIVEL